MPPHEGERVEIVDTTWQMSRDVDGGDTRQHYRPDYAVNNQHIMDTSPARIRLLILEYWANQCQQAYILSSIVLDNHYT